MKNGRVLSLGAAVLLAVGLVVGVYAADGIEWFGALPAVNLSHSQDVMDESNLALGPSEHVAAIWAGANNPGVFLAQAEGGQWSPPVTLTEAQPAWYPVVAYSGTEAIAAWVQGAARYPRSLPRAVLQKDANALQAQTVAGPLYGNMDISLLIAPTGMHMIFVATTESANFTRGDLYYTHRYFTETTWLAPTIVVTYGQVIPAQLWTPGMAAGIWAPRFAVNADGTQFHVVWEQEMTTLTHTVWYGSALWEGRTLHWDTLQQVSPLTQPYTVRPNVSVGATGKVHIVWTELIRGSGGLTNPEAQHINYLQLGTIATRISGAPIKVNNNKPTWATSSMALNGQYLCVVWHGFYTGDKEEIIMRCSPDEGKTWQDLVNVSDSQELLSLFPTIKIDAMGQVHVAWAEFRLSDISFVYDDLYYRTGKAEVWRVFLPLVMRTYR